MTEPHPVFPNGEPRAEPVPAVLVFVTIAIMAAILIPGMLFVAKEAEQRRLEAIANAEEKYSATYLRKSGDGEGGGIWRLSDGVVISCRIGGAPVDPTLKCGKWGDEPIVVTQRQADDTEHGQGTS